MNQEKWRQESHESMSKRITEHHEAEDFIGYHAWSPIDAQNAYYEGYIAARKKAQEEIDALDLSVDAMTSGFCLLEKRHRQFTYELEDEIQKLKEENGKLCNEIKSMDEMLSASVCNTNKLFDDYTLLKTEIEEYRLNAIGKMNLEIANENSKLKEEIEKRDRLLDEAKILLTANTHKLSQEEWLKQYEEMRGGK